LRQDDVELAREGRRGITLIRNGAWDTWRLRPDSCNPIGAPSARKPASHPPSLRIDYAHMRRASEPRKVPTNLSLPRDLVRRAKALRLNLSDVVETALEEAIRRSERQEWLDENQEAIELYNAMVERRGVFGDDWRRF
jgi:antitoxin CcdA